MDWADGIKNCIKWFSGISGGDGDWSLCFHPQVPLMIAEHQFSLTGAGLVAAFNYLGYLFGAFDAMRASRHVERRLWLGVWGRWR